MRAPSARDSVMSRSTSTEPMRASSRPWIRNYTVRGFRLDAGPYDAATMRVAASRLG